MKSIICPRCASPDMKRVCKKCGLRKQIARIKDEDFFIILSDEKYTYDLRWKNNKLSVDKIRTEDLRAVQRNPLLSKTITFPFDVKYSITLEQLNIYILFS